MAHVSGETRNGFSYEADYEPASAGRVQWTATFRQDGDYAGMRHGILYDQVGVAAEAVAAAVKSHIDSTWTDAG